MNIWGLPKITANRNVVTPALDSAFRKIHVNPTSLNNFSLSWNPWMHCWNIDSRSTLSYLSSAQSLHHQDPCSYPVLPQGGAAGVLVVERLYSGRRSLGSHRHLWVVYGLSQWQQLRKQKNTPGWVIYSKWDWDTRDVFELISIPLICYLWEDRTEEVIKIIFDLLNKYRHIQISVTNYEHASARNSHLQLSKNIRPSE